MTAIKTRERGWGEPVLTAARAAPVEGGAGRRWLMVAAERAGLASGSWRSLQDSAPNSRALLPHVATRRFGTGTGSVRAAREFTVGTLFRWGAAERSEDIAIVVSELLTNALRHALTGPGDIRPRRPIRLGLLQPATCVLCAVADPAKAVPVPQAPSCATETGRGLHIIQALSDQWGYTALNDTGKVVWATFYSAQLAPPPPSAR